jgi:hypothetical protein
MGWGNGGASLTGHDLAVTAVTAVIVGPRIPRAVTAVDYRAGRDRRDSVSLRHGPWGAWATVAAATAVTGRAFVTRPGGHRGRRDRRDLASLRHAPWGGTPATVGADAAL